jgi:hypothetical protein
MNKTVVLYLMLLLIAIFTPKYLISQSNNTIDVKLNVGFSLNYDFSEGGAMQYATYIAPDLRFKKHEFYVGPLLGSAIWDSPLIGAIGGYRYYFIKEPSRMNMFLHYDLEYLRYRYIDNWAPQHHKNKYDNYSHVIGYGFSIYMDKKNRYCFFSSCGYSIRMEDYSDYFREIKDFIYSQIYLSAGFSFKLVSFNKNAENK